MKTDLTIFKSTDELDIICEFVDDNSVKCHCYLDYDTCCRDLHKFIKERKNIVEYSVSVDHKTYTYVGSSDKVKPKVRLKDIPESFYDDKNVELIIH